MLTTIARFTTTLIEYDESDTDGYGDACEPGTGWKMTDGWVDPDAPLQPVIENRDDAPVTVFNPLNGETREEWIKSLVDEYLGTVDEENDGTYYGTAEHDNYTSPYRAILAMHLSEEDVKYVVKHAWPGGSTIVAEYDDESSAAQHAVNRANNKPVDGTLFMVSLQLAASITH